MTIIEIHTKDGSEKTEFIVTGEILVATLKDHRIHEHINLELIRALSEKLAVSRQHITIHSGHSDHIKFVKIDSSLSKDEIFSKL